MFGRRRHAAPVSASKLTEKQLYELVHARLSAEFGSQGSWIISRRQPDSGDEIFHDVFADRLARVIATDLDLEQTAVTVRGEGRTAEPVRSWKRWGKRAAEPPQLAREEHEAPAMLPIGVFASVPDPALVIIPSLTEESAETAVWAETPVLTSVPPLAETPEFLAVAPTSSAAKAAGAAASAASSASEEAPDTADAAPESQPLVERTLLEPQDYPITVWAEPELIDPSLANPAPARNRSVA